MLDVFIIEELKRREANRKKQDDRPRLELPLTSEEDLQRDRERDSEEDDSSDTTIVIEM